MKHATYDTYRLYRENDTLIETYETKKEAIAAAKEYTYQFEKKVTVVDIRNKVVYET
jgi:hypothetical protein